MSLGHTGGFPGHQPLWGPLQEDDLLLLRMGSRQGLPVDGDVPKEVTSVVACQALAQPGVEGKDRNGLSSPQWSWKLEPSHELLQSLLWWPRLLFVGCTQGKSWIKQCLKSHPGFFSHAHRYFSFA